MFFVFFFCRKGPEYTKTPHNEVNRLGNSGCSSLVTPAPVLSARFRNKWILITGRYIVNVENYSAATPHSL